MPRLLVALFLALRLVANGLGQEEVPPVPDPLRDPVDDEAPNPLPVPPPEAVSDPRLEPLQEPAPPVRPREPEGPTVVGIEFKRLAPDGESELDGLIGHEPARVAASLGVKVGEPLRVLQEGVRRVWSDFGVIVRYTRAEPVPGGVLLVVGVLESAIDYAPRFVGNASYKETKLREWAELGDRAQIYVHEKEKVAQRLERGYRLQGFHFVEVEPRVSSEGGADEEAARVLFEIREGPRVRSTKVFVNGNEAVPDRGWGPWRGGLRKLAGVQTKGRGIFRWWGKPFVEELLQADVLAMRQVYRDRGWRDVKVEVERLEFNADRSRVKVHLIVDEGPLYRVGSVTIEALEKVPGERRENGEAPTEPAELLFPLDDLLAELELKPGVPFERARVEHDERALRNFYGERGYLAAVFFADPQASSGWDFLEPDVWHDPEKAETHVVYRIHQGLRRRIREVRVSGNSSTRDKVVRREISALPGQIANVRDLDRSLSRIRGTGYFADRNDPTHPPEIYVVHEVEGDPESVDIVYELEEGRVVDLALSGGVTSDSGIVGLISLTMRNFDSARTPSSPWAMFGEVYRKEALHGNGETFAIDLSPGSEVNYGRILYSHPDLFGSHFDRIGLTAEFVLRERRFSSHDESRLRGELIFSRLFGQGDTSVRGGPIYQRLDLSDLDFADDPAEQRERLPRTLRQSQDPTDFHGLNFEFRKTSLDNRLNPRSGGYLRWNNDVYGGPLGGDQDVWQSEVSYDRYIALGDDELVVRPGLFLSVGAAVAQPYGDTDFLHYGERYFLGGSTTMRGFQFRGVGPNEGDFAIGGETMHRGTFEYRHPLYSTPIPGTARRQEMVRGTLFLDWGVLDPDPFALDPDELRVSAGFGFGLTYPIPLSVNFGWPLRKGEGDETDVFSFRISYR